MTTPRGCSVKVVCSNIIFRSGKRGERSGGMFRERKKAGMSGRFLGDRPGSDQRTELIESSRWGRGAVPDGRLGNPGVRRPEGIGEGKDGRKMSEGHEDQLVGFMAGLLLGAAIGATTALLSAPYSGRRTRRRLGRAAVGLKRSTAERWDDVADEIQTRVEEVLSGAKKRLGSE